MGRTVLKSDVPWKWHEDHQKHIEDLKDRSQRSPAWSTTTRPNQFHSKWTHPSEDSTRPWSRTAAPSHLHRRHSPRRNQTTATSSENCWQSCMVSRDSTTTYSHGLSQWSPITSHWWQSVTNPFTKPHRGSNNSCSEYKGTTTTSSTDRATTCCLRTLSVACQTRRTTRKSRSICAWMALTCVWSTLHHKDNSSCVTRPVATQFCKSSNMWSTPDGLKLSRNFPLTCSHIGHSVTSCARNPESYARDVKSSSRTTWRKRSRKNSTWGTRASAKRNTWHATQCTGSISTRTSNARASPSLRVKNTKMNNGRNHSNRAPPQPDPVSSDLLAANDKSYLLIVDRYSKYPLVVEFKNLPTSRAVTKATKHYCAIFGRPDTIISDNGTQYTGAAYQEFVREWEINHETSSPNYPRSNGLAERHVRHVKSLLKKAIKSGQDLHMVLMNIRATPVDGNLPSPAEMLLGKPVTSLLPNRGEPGPAAQHEYLKKQGRKWRFITIEKVWTRNYHPYIQDSTYESLIKSTRYGVLESWYRRNLSRRVTLCKPPIVPVCAAIAVVCAKSSLQDQPWRWKIIHQQKCLHPAPLGTILTIRTETRTKHLTIPDHHHQEDRRGLLWNHGDIVTSELDSLYLHVWSWSMDSCNLSVYFDSWYHQVMHHQHCVDDG